MSAENGRIRELPPSGAPGGTTLKCAGPPKHAAAGRIFLTVQLAHLKHYQYKNTDRQDQRTEYHKASH